MCVQLVQPAARIVAEETSRGGYKMLLSSAPLWSTECEAVREQSCGRQRPELWAL